MQFRRMSVMVKFISIAVLFSLASGEVYAREVQKGAYGSNSSTVCSEAKDKALYWAQTVCKNKRKEYKEIVVKTPPRPDKKRNGEWYCSVKIAYECI